MVVKLDDVVSKISGNVDRFTTDLKYYLGGEHYESDRIAIYNKGVIKDNLGVLGFKFHFPFVAGDTIFMSRNPHLKKAGMITYDGICSDTSYILRTKDQKVLDERYLPLVLQNEKFWRWFEENKSGSVNYLLNWKTLKEYEFDLPSIDEQRRIADMAWAIEDAIVSYEKMISSIDELVKSQFIEMFGDPNANEDAVSFETAFTIRDDLRKPINDAKRSEMHSGELYPYYGANGQVDSINQYLMDCEAICIAEDCGAYGSGEETAYIVRGKCWVNNHAHVVIPKECCDIEYAKAFFKVLDLTSYVSGTTRLKLTQGKMKEIPIVLPSLEKQTEFANFVRQSDKSKCSLQRAMSEAKALQKIVIESNFAISKEEE